MAARWSLRASAPLISLLAHVSYSPAVGVGAVVPEGAPRSSPLSLVDESRATASNVAFIGSSAMANPDGGVMEDIANMGRDLCKGREDTPRCREFFRKAEEAQKDVLPPPVGMKPSPSPQERTGDPYSPFRRWGKKERE
mmetsp:Transcript_113751/g.317718  ORF Transcript_113751/g.317718 Transcript_113751/m.317718 type:complete len:139 (-) Transcript_113751:135-551(-)